MFWHSLRLTNIMKSRKRLPKLPQKLMNFKKRKEINVLGFRIGYITESVEKLEILLKQRIIATYEQSFISNLELLLTSRDFSDLLLRLQYVKQVQENAK